MGLFSNVFGKKAAKESIAEILYPFVGANFALLDKDFIMKNADCIYAVKFYFIGAIDMLCQSLDKDDMVFGQTSTEVLEYIGFSHTEAFGAMKLFIEESMNSRAQIFLQAGAKEIQRFTKNALSKDSENTSAGCFGLQVVLKDHTSYGER